jgi:glutathione S-transferase
MAETPTLTLYHAPQSRSVRPRWCLEEMGLPYELERLSVAGEARGNVGGEAYKAVNPLQKVPALKDGDQVILESLAICEYLANRYGPSPLVVKPDEADYARYLEWLHFGEATMSMSINLMLAHVALLPEKHRNPAMAKWALDMVSAQLKLLAERGLENGQRDFLAGGRLTLADMSLGYMLFLLKITKQFHVVPDVVSEYFDRLRARPAWQRATAD